MTVKCYNCQKLRETEGGKCVPCGHPIVLVPRAGRFMRRLEARRRTHESEAVRKAKEILRERGVIGKRRYPAVRFD
jgi:DNA-directed RNA polymerase subunit RPC12/RpoP